MEMSEVRGPRDLARELVRRAAGRHLSIGTMSPFVLDANVRALEHKLTGPLSLILGVQHRLERFGPITTLERALYLPVVAGQTPDGGVAELGAWYRPTPQAHPPDLLLGDAPRYDWLYWATSLTPPSRLRAPEIRYSPTAREALDRYYDLVFDRAATLAHASTP